MELSISQEEIKDYLKLKALSKLASLKEKIQWYQKKYTVDFLQFEKSVVNSEEDFERWDDYIEWKAYEDLKKDLTVKLAEIDHAGHIKIIK